MKKYIKITIVVLVMVLGYYGNKANKNVLFDLDMAKAECIPVTELPDGGAILLMIDCHHPEWLIAGCEDAGWGYCSYATLG